MLFGPLGNRSVGSLDAHDIAAYVTLMASPTNARASVWATRHDFRRAMAMRVSGVRISPRVRAAFVADPALFIGSSGPVLWADISAMFKFPVARTIAACVTHPI